MTTLYNRQIKTVPTATVNIIPGVKTAVFGTVFGLIISFGTELRLEGVGLAILSFGPMYLLLDRKLVPGLLVGPCTLVFIWHGLEYAIAPLAQRYILAEENFIEDGLFLAQLGAVIGLATFAIFLFLTFNFISDFIKKRISKGKHPLPEPNQVKDLPPLKRITTIQNQEPPTILPGEESQTNLHDQSWQTYTVLLIGISLVILGIGTFSGALQRVGGYNDNSLSTLTFVNAFSSVYKIVFFFLGYLAVKHRGGWTRLWLLSYLLYAIFWTLQGSRGPIFEELVVSSIGAVWAGFKARRVLLVLAGSIVIFIPFAGILGSYRSDTTYTSRYSEGVFGQASAFLQATEDYFNNINTDDQQHSLQPFITAVSADVVDRVMLAHPSSMPFDGWENADAVFYSFIPKVFYPDRPEIGDANTLAQHYGFGSADGTTSAYFPTVAEGYRRFGWIGIPFMYMLCGLIYGLVVALTWAKRATRDGLAMLIFVVLQSQYVWFLTFNQAVNFLVFIVPKYWLFFFALTKLQDIFTSKLQSKPDTVSNIGLQTARSHRHKN